MTSPSPQAPPRRDPPTVGHNAFPNVFIVVDPVQDYDETMEIWGVFGSLAAAKRATSGLRTKYLEHYRRDRRTQLQQWNGPTLIKTWTYTPPTEYHRVDEGWTEKVLAW